MAEGLKLHHPWMVAVWPGMGHVALNAGVYLLAKLGMDVIAELRQRKVSTPAILIISQPNKVLSDRAAAARVPIVEKPLLSNALVEKIREVCATT